MKGYKPDLTKCIVCGREIPEYERMAWIIRGKTRFIVHHPSTCYDKVVAADREAKGRVSELLNLLVEM